MSDTLPRWDVSDVHESLTARTFVDDLERVAADLARLEALVDERDVRATAPRPVTEADGTTADLVIDAYNSTTERLDVLRACTLATVSTNSRDDAAQGLLSQIDVLESRTRPVVARLAEWTRSLGAADLAAVSARAAEHIGPLTRLSARADHQMSEAEEGLYAELAVTGPSAWGRLHGDLTSQLSWDVDLPAGPERLPMPAIRGLATHPDPEVRRAAYEAERAAWPTVAVACAAAMNGVKGAATVVNRRRGWSSPLDASLFANSVSRATFDAMQAAVVAALPDFRRWMQAKARLHGHLDGALRWWDLFAPVPQVSAEVTWQAGLDIVRGAFGAYGGSLAGLVDRSIDERWIDAAPRDGKVGGAFCMSLIDDRSLVLLNWSDSLDGVQTAAHELGHAYHNVQLAHRTPLQKQLPMALAETASIFCETLVVEEGLSRLQGVERLALLDADLIGTNQVVVDIQSRFRFETEVFERRRRRTLGAAEMDELMNECQAAAYGDGIDQSTAHPHMWILKPHYYSSHFYNWPYTYGQLFGMGLHAVYRTDPDRFRAGYDDLLSRAGMDTAEGLAASFEIDVTDEGFWTASLDIVRGRIDEYERLASELR